MDLDELLPPINPRQLVDAFERWDHDYRANPDGFWSTEHHLLKETPESYGKAAAECLIGYLLGERKP